MSKRSANLTPIAAAVGISLAAGAAWSNLAQADQNPFMVVELPSGYMVSAAAEGRCGEAKCGGKKELEGKGKHGVAKGSEGRCGEAKCGGKKESEGKCGEGKCGSDKDAEGKCGEGKCGKN